MLRATEEHFLRPGRSNSWWDRLQPPYETYHEEERLGQALDYMPDPEQACWFVPETDDGKQLRLVFELYPPFLPTLLGECYGFEYNLVGKRYAWFIAETDHSVFMVKRLMS